jgi:hypothetical protein
MLSKSKRTEGSSEKVEVTIEKAKNGLIVEIVYSYNIFPVFKNTYLPIETVFVLNEWYLKL